MSKINETNYPRRTQANYEDTDMLVIQESGGNTYTTRLADIRADVQEAIADKADQDALAPVENGSTASQAYAIGEHFMRDGAFCTAIAAIASGGSFTLNTNYVVGTIADAFSSLSSDLTSVEAVTPTINPSVGSLARNQSYREKIGTQYIYHLDFQIQITADAASSAYVVEIPDAGTMRNVQLLAIAHKFSGGGNYLLIKWSNSIRFLNGDVTIPADYYNITATFVV